MDTPTTPLTGAQTLHPNSVKNVTPQIEYSEAAKTFINFRRQRMIAARDARDMARPEYDDMPFLKYYDILKKADDQYIAPRKNKQDTSINVGTIRDKDTTLVEYAHKYDFEPVAQVFDDSDTMLEDLAEAAEDMVRKSKLMEDYKSKLKLTIRSMVSFGTAMVEDAWVERWVIEKTLENGFKAGLGSTEAKWTEKLVKKYEGAQAKLWDLRKCYFGDMRKFFMNGPQGQPYFFVVEYESYDETKAIFQNWDRWKYVPTTVIGTPEVTAATIYSPWWTLRPITEYSCEKIYGYDPIANEFYLTINGVDMLPIMEKKTTDNGVEKTLVSGYPLTEISPSGAIPFAKYDLEPMHDFAISKSQPGKMRVLADVENMMVKLFIRMLKQKSDPTMGNKSGRMFGSEVSDPATVINDIRDGDLFPILPQYQGASSPDFSMYEMIKKELDKNSVERSFQGTNPSSADKTATQEMNELKAQSLKVASTFDGIISGENQLNWLRTYNLIKNWTRPVDTEIDLVRKELKNIYRTITMPTTIDGGQKATKKIVFTKDTSKGSDDVHQEEIDATKEGSGSEHRTTYIHPELLAIAKLKWYYTCVPVPNGSDPLSYMLFAKQIVDAQTFFGADSLNVKKLKHKFAAATGMDFDTWFISEMELDQKKQVAAQQAQVADPAAPMQQKGPTIGGAAKGQLPAQALGGVMR